MDVEISEAERLLKLLTDSIEQGKNFAIEQAPDVIQQLIAYGRCYYTVSLIIATIVTLTFLCLAFLFKRASDKVIKQGNSADSEGWIVASVISAIVTLISGGVCCHLIERVLMTWVAPKLYAIEYLTTVLGQ